MDSVFQIFEGVCPLCEGELEIRQVSGYPQFHQNYSFTEGEVVVWDGVINKLDDIGQVEFHCSSCLTSIEVYCGYYGDWVSSV